MISFNPEYQIGDRVYHNTPEGPAGTVVDVIYSIRTQQCRYNVVFGMYAEQDVHCFAEELSEDKVII